MGHEQASATAPYLASLRPAALWSSDLVRARETCAYLEKEAGLVAEHDARLREFHVGERQGLTIPEFASRFPQEYEVWVRGDSTLRLPGAELPSEVEARMLAALRECLASLEPGETGVVVTHGACLKVGLAVLLGWSADQAVSLRAIDNCAWATVEELKPGGRLRLAGYNQSVPVDFASDAPVG